MARLTALNKYRLLFLVSALKNCGPINVVYGIIKGLNRDRFDVFLLSLSDGPDDKSKERFKALNIEISCLGTSRIRGFFSNRQQVQQFIKDQKIDLLHSHGFRADFINSGVQQVYQFSTIHNYIHEDYQHRYGATFGYLLGTKHKQVLKKIEYRICCSQYLAENYLLKDKIRMQFVRNGIDTESFSFVKSSAEKIELRKQLRLPENWIIFVVCGAISHLKNPQLIIDAFRREQIEDSLLLFLGDGELLNQLSSENSDQSIEFRGRTNRVADYLNASDYYISASLTEGMPNSVLEAISTETPVILSNIKAHREIVGKNYSYLFYPENRKELQRILHQIQKNKNLSLTKQLRQKVETHFSIQSMSRSYQQLYLQALDGDKITDS